MLPQSVLNIQNLDTPSFSNFVSTTFEWPSDIKETLSIEELHCVSEVREKLFTELQHPRYDNLFLLRFCKARGFHVGNATSMLSDYCKWRKNINVDHIIDNPFPAMKLLRKYYPHGYHGTCKEGRPVYIDQIGSLNVSKLLEYHDIQFYLDYWIKDYETLFERRLPACSIQMGSTITQIVSIVDLKGFGFSHFSRQSQQVLKALIQLAQSKFPETLGKMFVVNAPGIFSITWNFLKPLIDPKTLAKVSVSSKFGDLHETVDPSELPTFLGGSCVYERDEDWMDNSLGPWNDHKILYTLLSQYRPHAPTCLFPPELIAQRSKMERQKSGGGITKRLSDFFTVLSELSVRSEVRSPLNNTSPVSHGRVNRVPGTPQHLNRFGMSEELGTPMSVRSTDHMKDFIFNATHQEILAVDGHAGTFFADHRFEKDFQVRERNSGFARWWNQLLECCVTKEEEDEFVDRRNSYMSDHQ